MTTSIWLRDIVAYALQAAVLVGAGAALASLLRIRDPRAALAFWRTLLLVCLALPLCQPWNTAAPPPVVAAPTVATIVVDALEAPVAVPRATWNMAQVRRTAVVALAGGILLRTAWLALGACGLWRLRRRAAPLEPLPAAIRDAQHRSGVSAAMCVSDGVTSPITFGLLRPVVVFPPTVSSMPPHVQEAIACHELLHIRRRDWLAGLLEEGVRTLLWFHPAIWWLIDRIQLSREQVVDRATIRMTESRERYIEALLVVARARVSIALIPASPFLRRRSLKKRVAQILQESTMTTRHIVTSLGASAVVIVFAAGFAVRAFPLQAQGRVPGGVPGGVVGGVPAGPVQIVKGSEQLMHGELPEYPRRAIEQKAEGDMVLELAIDDRGEVADARVLSGPDELRRVALGAALHWHFVPAVRSSTIQVTLRFQVPVLTSENTKHPESEREVELKHAWAWSDHMADYAKVERQMEELKKAIAAGDRPAEQLAEFKARYEELSKVYEKVELDRHPATAEIEIRPDWEEAHKVYAKLTRSGMFENGPLPLAAIRTRQIPEGIAADIVKAAGFGIGSQLDEKAIERIQKAAFNADPHLHVEFSADGKGGIVILIVPRE